MATSILNSAGNALARMFPRVAERMFGYDAAESNTKRRNPNGVLQSEDNLLTESKRRKVVSGSREIVRNFEIAAWAIRKHLDFVATHNFQCRTGNKDLDAEVERLMQSYGRAENCDIAGRHPLRRSIRLAEARRCIDSDVGCLKLATGHLQWIEGDRIRNPNTTSRLSPDELKRITHGVLTNAAGRAIKYAVHNRNGTGFVYDRMVSADRMIVHAFYDRFDQIRGVSPITAALNRFQDVYENFDYALAKAKVAQLFGLVTKRNADESAGEVTSEDDEDGEPDKSKFQVDFGKGPIHLDLDIDEDAEFLENKTPSTEFREFTQTMVGAALKSLDIPFNFYDESFTNFFGSKAALTLYIKSAREKRADVQDLLRSITEWRLGLYILDGELTLPSSIEPSELFNACQWIPAGLPWWDIKDVQADVLAVAAGLNTRQQIRRERFGDDWVTGVADGLEAEQDALQKRNLTLSPLSGVWTPGNDPGTTENEPAASNAA